MRRLFATLCCYVAASLTSVYANEPIEVDADPATVAAVSSPPLSATTVETEEPVSVAGLLTNLTEVKLSKALPVLKQLETLGGLDMLPMFKGMLEGDLYFVKASKEVVIISTVDGELTAQGVLSKKQLADVSKSQLKKIRVNNKLRGFLKQAIARLHISHPDADKRLAAVQALLTHLSDDTIATLTAARVNEADEDVQAMIDLALALYQADSKDSAERLIAVNIMADSLESDARNKLVKLAENDTDTQVKVAAAKALKQINEKIEFYGFIDQLFFGLSLGSVLLLAAIGLAITFGVMGVINMAHGEMIMLGAYTTYVVQLMMPNAIEYSLWVAIPLAFVVSGCVGILIERGVIRHLHGRPLETLLATFGISLILQQLVRTVFSPLNRQVASPEWMSGSLEINPILSLTLNRLYILAFALLVFGLLLIILRKTSLGLNVRAVSQNRDMAKAMGIRTDWVDAMTFGLGSGIAGIAGVALSQLTNVGPNLGQAYIIDSFMVVVFGGVGNLWGTLVAAFSLGIANKFLEPVTGAVLASIFVLIFIILFIQKRPKGLFPQKGRAAE
ncbi:urea ABC transporter permease subunit UrtB [Neptuniibacter sp. 1_MG-2023]|uniref:urea ABC transporter permease subunit UrtB n=1 Tax=Neptuniibacter sp. 1_MG-2023 TaxID=3062662 RepID=UPI0026E3CBAD|nr:urea ABC transporter permease subunit UrtB [Neptuniibacter sp. 1_MG-2023]MDO6594692.1 urea ABC transporter permease subunit UrtB [Neptuniibacter sp. 1_MG-2023]